MKKAVSIFFLSIYLLSSNSEILELAKIPLLIEHYKEHKEWNQDLSFVGFLYIHYFQDEVQYGDQARDKQLPFKTPSHSVSTSIAFIVPSPDFSIVSKSVFQVQEQNLIFDSFAYSSNYLSSIWQPPKLS